jgi:hypothetical protein
MFYNPHDVLTLNKLFHFIIGNRGCGKTYGFKKWGIKRFLQTGRKFIYLRRYHSEFEDLNNFFNDVKQEYPENEFSVKGNTFYCDGEICGYAVALSTALTKKSVSYHDVDNIFFDEFVIDSKVIHYIKNEAVQFLEFYETVARLRDNVRVFFISNAISITNPYFHYWKIKPNSHQRFTKYEHMVVEFVKNPEFVEAKYKTRFGQIIKGTEYGDYAVENTFLKDNYNFVDKKSGSATFTFSVFYNGSQYGIWTDHKKGLVYVSRNIDPYNEIQLVITDTDHKPNMLLIKSASRSHYLRRLIQAYEYGFLRFEDMSIKNQTLEMMSVLKAV